MQIHLLGLAQSSIITSAAGRSLGGDMTWVVGRMSNHSLQKTMKWDYNLEKKYIFLSSWQNLEGGAAVVPSYQ